MSAPSRKPPSSERGGAERNQAAPGGSPSQSPARSSTSTIAGSNGVARSRSTRGANGSPVSARAAVKKPAGPSGLNNSTTPSLNAEDEDARIENAALMDSLKEQLERTEQASDEFRKQVVVLQSRLDDAMAAQGVLEERVHEEEEKVEMLQNEKREQQRQRNELERIYEAERVTIMKDREESQAREEDMQAVIQRLKDSLSQQNSLRPGMADDGRIPRQGSFPSPGAEGGDFAPSSLQRSNSRNNSKLLLQKDKVIESLRLEIAEMQVKIMEMENMGGSKVHEVEKALMETRMANARLMEENESFQVLLGERTLNGDFFPTMGRRASIEEPANRGHQRGKSLADELGSESPTEEPTARERKLEMEVTDAKEQNKALTLYINKIIERLLQHQGYEAVLGNAQEGPHGSSTTSDKALPPLPPPKDDAEEAAPQQSFLQRATSVVRGANKPRPRPQTMIQAPAQVPAPSVTENPTTAPSIPFSRGQTSTQSKRSSLPVSAPGGPAQTHRSPSGTTIPAAAGIVGNMYKGPPAEQISPSLASPTRTSTSFFSFSNANANAAAAARRPSGNQPSSAGTTPGEEGGRQAALDALTGGGDSHSIDTSSPPRSIASSQDRSGQVMAGNKIRPLRLVQQQNPEAAAAEEARLKNNRQSWIGGVTNWFSKGQQIPGLPTVPGGEQAPMSAPPQMPPPLRRDTSETSQSSVGAERKEAGSRSVSFGDDRTAS